jgi:ABC-2 type transport system ATP-binding protein
VLFSSHILQEVEAICDRVIIINKGKIVADDTVTNLQQGSTENIVRVSFKEALEPAWLSRLQSANSVTGTDNYNWSIRTTEPEALRKQILEMSLQHNLNIVSLHSENASLEQVFRNLTGGSTAPTPNA